MGKLFLEVVTPEKVVVSQEIETVTAPGSLGEFGILEGHIPFLSGILPGEIRFTSDNKTEYLAVSTGFSEVSDDKVSILVDTAEKGYNIDVERAKKSMERAGERLKKAQEDKDIDFIRAEAALRRAIVRINIAEKVL